jgi:pimeloyl-ACP methyl ester carboxylesterase
VPSTTHSQQRVNGIGFHVEESGSGEPLVLVHGAFGSTVRWSLIVDDLAESFHVVNYDRRGHGNSSGGVVPPTRVEQEDDLAGLIERLGLGPVHLVGSSFGGAMALSLAARRSDLVRTVAVHEPPLVGFAAPDPLIDRVLDDVADVSAMIDRGALEAACREFVERIALGAGAWELLPTEVREAMVRHAYSWAGEMRDPDAWTADLDGIEQVPVLLTSGDRSPAWFGPIMTGLRAALPDAIALTMLGAGHTPHVTHPAEYVDLLTHFAAGAR